MAKIDIVLIFGNGQDGPIFDGTLTRYSTKWGGSGGCTGC